MQCYHPKREFGQASLFSGANCEHSPIIRTRRLTSGPVSFNILPNGWALLEQKGSAIEAWNNRFAGKWQEYGLQSIDRGN
jgi:hypothetical protein